MRTEGVWLRVLRKIFGSKKDKVTGAERDCVPLAEVCGKNGEEETCVQGFVSFRFVILPSSTYLFTAGVEGFYLHLITLKHAPQSVGLLWTRDRPVAETST
jgi:hypothetical protein